MQFSKIASGQQKSSGICYEQSRGLKKWNRRKQNYVFALLHGKHLWETTEWGCIGKTYLQITVESWQQKGIKDTFTCGMAMQKMEQAKRSEGEIGERKVVKRVLKVQSVVQEDNKIQFTNKRKRDLILSVWLLTQNQ